MPIGFPPPNEELRDRPLSLWNNCQKIVASHLHTFIDSLLSVTSGRPKDMQSASPFVRRYPPGNYVLLSFDSGRSGRRPVFAIA